MNNNFEFIFILFMFEFYLGWCGTSWALSTVSVAQDRFAIQSSGVESAALSSQQILSCQKRNSGCFGGRVDVAWNYFRRNGYVSYFS